MSETMTPYAASKVVNNWLAEQGAERKLPPQMFYNYKNKGYIKSDAEGKINMQDLRDWFDNKYKQSKKSEKSETEVIVDNDGTVGEW